MVNCDECGEKLLTDHASKLHDIWVWCRKCGLVFDDHPMGTGISGLMIWLKFYGVSKSDMRKITSIYIATNLRDARVAAMEYVEVR